MSYANFQPTVWAVGIERDLERLCVFVEDCNRNYEGKVTKQGESVTILGVGKPTIKRILKKARNDEIDDAETIEDTSVVMYINQIAYFNYMIGDIDKAQSQGGVMEALQEETSEGLANEVDKHIASMAVDSSVKALYGNSPVKVVDHETTVEGEKYVLDVLDEAYLYLQENDVSASTKVVVTVDPRFFKVFKRAYIKLDTSNSDKIKNGKIAMYGNMVVKISNNVHKTKTTDGKNTVSNIMVRTQRAVAFAQPHTHTEPYRPEKRFADAVKGFILFDAKVVRPKEIINANVVYA
jgi:hypothetical protein